jgi:hypothetical protein
MALNVGLGASFGNSKATRVKAMELDFVLK